MFSLQDEYLGSWPYRRSQRRRKAPDRYSPETLRRDIQSDSTNTMSEDFCLEGWMQILLRSDYKTMDACRKTCRSFYDILTNDKFWLERCRLYGTSCVLPPTNWRHSALVDAFRKEDATIDSSKFKFEYRKLIKSQIFWKASLLEIERNQSFEMQARENNWSYFLGGHGIQVEGNDNGCDPDPNVHNCFAFSFGLSAIYRFINLVEWGVSEWILDHVRPKIRVSLKVNHRYDCGADIYLGCEMNYLERQMKNHPHYENRDNVDEERYKRKNQHWEQWTEAKWEEMSIEMDNYPSGLRHLTVMVAGKDSQFWAGFFGPKLASIEVQVILPNETILHSLKEDSRKDADDEVNGPGAQQSDQDGNGLLNNIRRMLPIFRGQRRGRHMGQQVFPP